MYLEFCFHCYLQGAGLELTQIPVSNKEKNYLDEQHTHLLQCLEKATVCVDTVESGL